MRPIVRTVGPLAAAAVNNIATSQTPAAAGFLALDGSLAAGSVFTASIAAEVLTVTAVASGSLVQGMRITAPGLTGTYVITRLGTGVGAAGTYYLNIAATLSSQTVYGNSVATLDTPRQVLLTFGASEVANTFVLTGTGPTGQVQSETIAGAAATAVSVLMYATVTSITISGAASGTIRAGTNGVATSPWIRMDDWAPSNISLQCTVTGTVNYTVQSTLDDPNSPINPVLPVAMTWVSSSDASVVGATTTQQSNFAFSPTFVRVLLNSGTGTVTLTVIQASNGPY